MQDLTVDRGQRARRPDRSRNQVRTVAIGSNVATVAAALSTLEEIIARARARGEHIVKLVHGQEDQRAPLRKALRQLTMDGVIRGFIPGEEWAPFHESARKLAQDFPVLKHNSDFGRRDPHLTIIVVVP